MSITIFRDGRLPLNWDMPLHPLVHRQRCSTRSLRAMRSLAGLIDMEGAMRHFTTLLMIAPGRPLTFCMRSGDYGRQILRTSFESTGRAVQETGSRFTRLAGTSFLSLLASVSIRDGETEELAHTGRATAGRPTDMCCGTHRDCECIW
jgi:hypothetical protein